MAVISVDAHKLTFACRDGQISVTSGNDDVVLLATISQESLSLSRIGQQTYLNLGVAMVGPITDSSAQSLNELIADDSNTLH